MSSTHLPGGNQALLGCSANELEGWAVAEGQPAFRGRQLHDWLYTKGARSFEAITVLPKSWRLSLQQRGITI
ncbi:MAG: 23S rRNA (adenine(2503)-C(2))-methyltransferase RlmN, partial [Cyanobacteriota bacterium]|nr:23S rRNA (adenine(2503)-C(2))-methyltransferase RlmN [Cyanobacteriota bacterium]